MADDEKNNSQVRVQIDEKTLFGAYSNIMSCSHNMLEFTMDYLHQPPASPTAKVQARVVVSPQHMKIISQVLLEQIRKYETQFGEIRISPQLPDVIFDYKGN